MIRVKLEKGYPLASDAEHKKFEPIWDRAFEIHKTAHDFSDIDDPNRPREGIINPIRGKPHFCNCYERAYRELMTKKKKPLKAKRKRAK